MSDRQTRRKFIATSATVAGGVVGAGLWQSRRAPSSSSSSSNASPSNSATSSEVASSDGSAAERGSIAPSDRPMPERPFGSTGESLPIFGLGGAGRTPLSQRGRDAESAELLETALELGIRYIDTAASYGPSEENIGRVLSPYRERLFLASKTAASDRDRAWRELERSLRRLKVDRLDLWQLHHVSFFDELDRLESPTGAMRALDEARDQGLVRYTGITGHHDPAVIAEGLRRYPFDMTLIPVNAADPHHPQPFLPVVMPVARELNVAVVGMKVPAYGKLLPAVGGMRNALGYALSVPGVSNCVVAAEDAAQLRQNVELARQFVPLGESQMQAIADRAAAAWEDVTFYRAWT